MKGRRIFMSQIFQALYLSRAMGNQITDTAGFDAFYRQSNMNVNIEQYEINMVDVDQYFQGPDYYTVMQMMDSIHSKFRSCMDR